MFILKVVTEFLQSIGLLFSATRYMVCREY